MSPTPFTKDDAGLDGELSGALGGGAVVVVTVVVSGGGATGEGTGARCRTVGCSGATACGTAGVAIGAGTVVVVTMLGVVTGSDAQIE